MFSRSIFACATEFRLYWNWISPVVLLECEALDVETTRSVAGVAGDRLDGETFPSNCTMVMGLGGTLVSGILSGSMQGDLFTETM